MFISLQEGPLPHDDDFYDFRKRVVEVVEDLAFMTGSIQMFQHIGNELLNPNGDWYTIEAALFLLRPLTRSINM